MNSGRQLSPQQAVQFALDHHKAGNLQAADSIYRQVLAVEPGNADALHLLGVLSLQTGDPVSAADLMRKAVSLNAKVPEYHNNLGNALTATGAFEEAVRSYQKALKLRPEYAEASNNLGNAFQKMERFEDAIAAYRRSIAYSPGYADAHNNLGVVLYKQGKTGASIESFRKAIEIKKDYASAYFNMGMSLYAEGNLDEAGSCLDHAIELAPDSAEAYSIKAVVLEKQGKLVEAMDFHRKSVSLDPENADAHSNMAFTLCNLGNLKEGIEHYRDALRIDSGLSIVHCNLIFYLDLVVGYDTAVLQAERKKWAAIHADPFFRERKFKNVPDPERILRIGYVSGDFNDHSAANGFVSLLGNYDRSRFRVYAYSNSKRVDDVTRLLQEHVTAWRDIHHLSDEEAAKLIVKDEIDILVDLSGYTDGNRLLVFARKPAPIQVSAMGYPTGTGMKAMDALFVDPIVVPPEETRLYAEEIRYLPCVIGYSSKKEYPESNELPALSSNAITFGSFNRLSKISDETLILWAKVLAAMPQSRMILKSGEFDDEVVRERMMNYFVEAGVSPERITFFGKTPWLDHVRTYNQVDIALDSFPHGGGITTIESIVMGVPVLTLKFPTFAGRASASILSTLDLLDWVAESEEDYIAIAVEKSKNRAKLAKLRRTLRDRFSRSLLGDPDYYVRAAEKEYRALWRNWCKKQ